MRSVIALDPGPEQSAYVRFDGTRVLDAAILPNFVMRSLLFDRQDLGESLAIEMVACYGLAVGASVFTTCTWIGRFQEIWNRFHAPADLLYRPDIKLHLCNSRRAKDPNVRQSLLDRFGGKEKAIGKKASPGPLYGIKSHLWSALAVGVVWFDLHGTKAK